MPAIDCTLAETLGKFKGSFHPLVPFDHCKERLVSMDFTQSNEALQQIDLSKTDIFCSYIDEQLRRAQAKFGIGGYDELRTLYTRSPLFDQNAGALSPVTDEPRRLHLGVDIWGPEGTPIFAPLTGEVHSFAFNDHFGDYGATIIIRHQMEQITFYTLYGHVSLGDLDRISEGQRVEQGNVFAHFGPPLENGHWPPHLHFQVIHRIGDQKGDYPGVCKYSERDAYLPNCPDPDLIANMTRYVNS